MSSVKSTAPRGRSIFVYEYLSAGAGLREIDGPLPESLEQEGLAMLRAVIEDFAAAGARVSTICRQRLDGVDPTPIDVHRPIFHDDEESLFCRLAGRADWSVVIAPELGGALLERCRLLCSAGGRLLASSETDLILSGDKHLACLHLAVRGLPVPRGITVDRGQLLPGDFAYPAVLKRRDGRDRRTCGWSKAQPIFVGRSSSTLGWSRFAGWIASKRGTALRPGGYSRTGGVSTAFGERWQFWLPRWRAAVARQLGLPSKGVSASCDRDFVRAAWISGCGSHAGRRRRRISGCRSRDQSAADDLLCRAKASVADQSCRCDGGYCRAGEVPLSFRAERLHWTADGRISKGSR